LNLHKTVPDVGGVFKKEKGKISALKKWLTRLILLKADIEKAGFISAWD